MKQYKNRRIIISLYAAAASMVILTGFTSLAAEKDTKAGLPDIVKEESAEWNVSGIAGEIRQGVLEETRAAAEEARLAYEKKLEEERRAAEEAARIAAEKAAAEAAVQADKELLAALIFCEAGNQPYEGQVAVGAVVMNRVKSGGLIRSVRMPDIRSLPCRRRRMRWQEAARSETVFISVQAAGGCGSEITISIKFRISMGQTKNRHRTDIEKALFGSVSVQKGAFMEFKG